MKPVLIYRLGSLGDTVVALPCLRKVAERFSARQRVLLTNVPVSAKAAPMASILEGAGVVDGALAYPLGLRSPGAILRLRSQIKALGADTLVYLAEGRGVLSAWRDLLFFRLCGLKNIIGLPLTPSLQRSRKDPITGELEPEHARLARTIAALGPIDFEDTALWDLRLSAAELRVADEALAPLGGAPYLAINMGGKSPARDWGFENWSVLISRLSGQFGQLGLLVVGASDDSERASRILQCWRGPGVDSCGRLSPRESAAALAGAAAFIGHDSGPLHLAACVGVPCVGLYGSLNRPRKWHPFGQHHTILHRMDGLQNLTVPEVAEAAKSILVARLGSGPSTVERISSDVDFIPNRSERSFPP